MLQTVLHYVDTVQLDRVHMPGVNLLHEPLDEEFFGCPLRTDLGADPAIKNNDHRYVRQLNLVLHLMYKRYFFHIYRIYALQCFCSN